MDLEWMDQVYISSSTCDIWNTRFLPQHGIPFTISKPCSLYEFRGSIYSEFLFAVEPRMYATNIPISLTAAVKTDRASHSKMLSEPSFCRTHSFYLWLFC